MFCCSLIKSVLCTTCIVAYFTTFHAQTITHVIMNKLQSNSLMLTQYQKLDHIFSTGVQEYNQSYQPQVEAPTSQQNAPTALATAPHRTALGARRMLLPPTLSSPVLLGQGLAMYLPASQDIPTVKDRHTASVAATDDTYGSMHSDSESCMQLSGLQPRLKPGVSAEGRTPNSSLDFSRHPQGMSEQHRSQQQPGMSHEERVRQQLQAGRLSLLSSPTVSVPSHNIMVVDHQSTQT